MIKNPNYIQANEMLFSIFKGSVVRWGIEDTYTIRNIVIHCNETGDLDPIRDFAIFSRLLINYISKRHPEVKTDAERVELEKTWLNSRNHNLGCVPFDVLRTPKGVGIMCEYMDSVLLGIVYGIRQITD